MLDDFGTFGRAYRETDERRADRDSIIANLLSGQYERPLQIIAFNTSAGFAHDVTAQIAREIEAQLRTRADEIAPSLRAFLDRACSSGTAPAGQLQRGRTGGHRVAGRTRLGGAGNEEAVPKVLRCAIYTRKSTEHNLDLAFTSLDAQREACEAYVRSQAGLGWRFLPEHYDDGAYSGASLERPALQALWAEVRSRKVDVVVVYKVDRLTRSLADFAKLIELFDAHDVSFVSTTQNFNTTSSMGRLTLNILLSFAQFEREVIGERVRDKIAASKRKGLWVGGPVPLGYAAVDKKIAIVPAEAETVRTIFTRYLELGSIRALIEDLKRRGTRTKERQLSDGGIRGGSRSEPEASRICCATASMLARSSTAARSSGLITIRS